MATAIAQPIAGVSSSRETEIEAIYPSIAVGVLGGVIGSIMEPVASIPVLVLRLPLYVIVGAAMAPLALLGYFLSKAAGSCYVLTNRSVQQRTILGGAMTQQTALNEIHSIEIDTHQSGYQFHNVGDLHLQNAQGTTLMTLKAIPNPERLSQILIDAREARMRSDQSLATIQARS